MPDEDPRPAARAKLDDAIREYAGAMYAADEGIIGVGGWNVIVHAATSDEGTDKYLTESCPGQPWHASIGLLRYGQGFYERPGDEDA